MGELMSRMLADTVRPEEEEVIQGVGITGSDEPVEGVSAPQTDFDKKEAPNERISIIKDAIARFNNNLRKNGTKARLIAGMLAGLAVTSLPGCVSIEAKKYESPEIVAVVTSAEYKDLKRKGYSNDDSRSDLMSGPACPTVVNYYKDRFGLSEEDINTKTRAIDVLLSKDGLYIFCTTAKGVVSDIDESLKASNDEYFKYETEKIQNDSNKSNVVKEATTKKYNDLVYRINSKQEKVVINSLLYTKFKDDKTFDEIKNLMDSKEYLTLNVLLRNLSNYEVVSEFCSTGIGYGQYSISPECDKVYDEKNNKSFNVFANYRVGTYFESNFELS